MSNEASPFQDISTNGNLEAEYLKQALEKYHEVLSEFSRSQLKLNPKGHGIGLQLVEKLCMQLGWRVELLDRQDRTIKTTF